MNAKSHFTSTVDARIDDSPLSTVQPDSAGRSAAWPPADFSPAVAAAIADLVVRYWQDCAAHADWSPGRRIDVIDLAPGNGYSGHQLIRALAARTRHLGSTAFCYVPVVPDRRWMSAASAAPEMLAYRQRGQLLPLIGQPDAPQSLLANGRLYQCDNPVVILAHDLWARLTQRLMAVHYGKLLEADLELMRSPDPGSSERPDWRPIDPTTEAPAFESLFAHYLGEFNSTPIPYPEGAVTALRRWRRTARHGYLMLAIAAGNAGERGLRLRTFPDLITDYRDDGRLPVNFDLLAHWARRHGAATNERDLPAGQALQMIMETPAESEAATRLAPLADSFDPAVFSRKSVLSESMRTVTGARKLEHRRQLLQMSGHDPQLLAEVGRDLTSGFARAAEVDRADWRVTLDEVWANFLPELVGFRLHDSLANVAMHCGHWQLARTALLRGLRHVGDNATDLANLAWCEMRTGRMQLGVRLVRQALAMEPGNPLALQVMARMQERLSLRDSGWRVELRHPTLPITLEPLDASHADAYFLQYRDPQIAIMTGLPPLKSAEETRQWILAAPEEKGRVSFAVLHRDHGFVAYVNLAVSGHASFFCFWTGVDFQGQRYATAAARLVFSHAAAMGISVMLTSAYKDNQRSIRALERLGFVRMSSQALPPDQDRVFFALIDPAAGSADAHQELVDYYARESLPLTFADPVGTNQLVNSPERPAS